ncbi:MAG TPA: pullulanase-type alpha-1,6-glucosidase [Pyrinomonadaceae bacterium]|jgi:pullulanase-type alpha-1,6-glucosidase|nr:pullulanase-type alpha-1,6-glucosidase [Pyrinomonadaceae bacterium]
MSSILYRYPRILWLSLIVLALGLVASKMPLKIVSASDTPAPSSVTIAGSLQSELGCSEDWQPQCAATHLNFDAEDTVWQRTFTVPAGSWEYKAPLNDNWDENYGANATRNGSNIPLNLGSQTQVKFYYDHETHWVADNKNKVIAVAPGSFQSELGCSNDWDPSCLRSWLQDPDGDGIYAFTTQSLPAGSYEVKVAINESWDENYGAGGAPGGANIPFTVTTDCSSTIFTYNSTTHVLTVSAGGAEPQPSSVTIAGSLQSELGCSEDWQPACAATHLSFDSGDGVWQGTFNIPAGSWEYKAPLNDNWDENYGANATRNGSNIGLNLSSASNVKFYYSHKTHWVADNKNKVIAVAPGSFQSELGCSGDWDPSCLRSWLQDPDGDGIYSFSTRSLPAGNYETKVAINESWDENYGAGGAPGGANIAFSVPASCAEVFFEYNASTHVLTVSAEGAPKGNLAKAQAHWVSEDTIAWNVGAVQPNWQVNLHYAPGGGLALDQQGVSGGNTIPLVYDPAGLPDEVKAKFPHISSYPAFKIPAAHLSEVPEALKSQLAVSAADGGGAPIDATSLQLPGVLDDLYNYGGKLGPIFTSGVPTLKLWAPTARSVKLHLFNDSNPSTGSTVTPMTFDPATGVWSITGASGWKNKFYLYEVEVYVRSTGQVEHNLVTDPYSLSLSRNSQRSQLIDLSDPSLKPLGWDALHKPTVKAPEDIVLYELHVRDFSANDQTVPENERGTFKAFTEASNGMQHLSALAQAGLTHVHLLPVFDIASINEDKSQWQTPAGDLSSYPPNSDQQQAAVGAVANQDAYNWGYDPWHYTVPEGSYATNPDGSARVLEFRQMVQSLAQTGLHTVMDVVYNHTNSAGQNDKSVLDKVVPGYYHRLNSDGNVETSSCCQNTATEHDMMEKLMIDSVVTWARQYKVDGFRFDLMGHHMKRNMLKLRQALDALTIAQDGVDGSKIYLYGEGWNFGEVANNARGVNATQLNMAGTGIGTFSDWMRDGVRGGGPFSGIQEQGFINGLFYDPNATNQGSLADQRARLLQEMDWIRIGLAGNLSSFPVEDRFGNLVTGAQVDYNGQPAGYTSDPQEVISYIEAHDNETLFDSIQLKAPASATLAERVRMQNLGLSIVTLGEGVPFIHAGAELLRSKSLDRNSYNSGDWFNKLDFTYSSNNWGVGLPPAGDNQGNWPVMSPLLGNPALKPASNNILDAFSHLREVLAIRRSTPLFRLRTAADINSRVRFYNTGPSQIPALIVMSISDGTGDIDRRYSMAVVLFNADDQSHNFQAAAFTGKPLALHPVLAASHDSIVRTASFNSGAGSFSIPARTTAVFLARRPLGDQILLLSGDVDRLIADGTLNAGQGNALKAKLNAALKQVEKSDRKMASNQLQAFINQVQAFVNTGVLPAVQGQALIAEANSIMGQLGL